MYATLTSPMLPSSTVENYLKAIYQGTAALAAPQRCCPWASWPRRSGVAPGTATTMVKTLAESGLVHYEPYAGVALTPAGRAAGRAGAAPPPPDRAVPGAGDGLLRGTRSTTKPSSSSTWCRTGWWTGWTRCWAGPRSIRTAIRFPNADGLVKPQEAQSLLTCPLQHAGDGDARHRSGQGVPALHRAAQPEAGRARSRWRRATPRPTACRSWRRSERRITIGTRAASKLLVQRLHG